MDIYITRNGQQLGPYSVHEARRNLRAGVIGSSDLAWHDGLSEWVPLSTIPGITMIAQSPTSSPQPPRPPQAPPVPTGAQTKPEMPISSEESDLHSNEKKMVNKGMEPGLRFLLGIAIIIVGILFSTVSLTIGIGTSPVTLPVGVICIFAGRAIMKGGGK